MRYTRKFTWANKQNIGKVDLRNFTYVIDAAVIKVIPPAYAPYVDVQKDNFIINTIKPIPSAISRVLGKEIDKISAIGSLHTPYDYKNGGHSNQIFKSKDIT